MNGQILFKGHITKLQKSKTQLSNSQKPDYGQVILSDTNQKILREAVEHLNNCINLLNTIS